MAGKIHVRDNTHDVGLGATIGAVGGLPVGLVFPPAFRASGVVGVSKHEVDKDSVARAKTAAGSA